MIVWLWSAVTLRKGQWWQNLPYLEHLQQRDGKSTINRTSRNAFQVQHEDQAVALDIEPERETKLQLISLHKSTKLSGHLASSSIEWVCRRELFSLSHGDTETDKNSTNACVEPLLMRSASYIILTLYVPIIAILGIWKTTLFYEGESVVYDGFKYVWPVKG